jgi:hypothetical protein
MADVKLSIDNIRFEDGKLWKPRYDNLIDYSRAPRGFQFEPAFTLCSAAKGEAAEVQAVLTIAPAENAAFDVLPDGRVRWMLLSNPYPGADVEVTVLDNPRECRTCLVTWKRTGAPLAALRICCRYTEGGPAAYSDPWAWSVVEGGVYLVILDPGEALPSPAQAVKEAGSGSAGKVRLLGIDEHHRPVYDLFAGKVPAERVPAELMAEPAFRAPHGARLDFKIGLDLPDTYADVRFKVGADGQAELFYAVPGTRPPSLEGATVGPERKVCTIEWRRPLLEKCTTGQAAAMTDPCRQWSTSNFYAELGFANQVIRVDPTVIEPPACDASGVCGPPRSEDE